MVRTVAPWVGQPVVRKIDHTKGQRTTMDDIDAEYAEKIEKANRNNPQQNRFTVGRGFKGES